MVVEVAERVGPSLDWWLAQPFAYLLWTYYHLQELDRRRGWLLRMRGTEQAWMNAYAFHDPDRIKQKREEILAEAASTDADETVLDRGRQLLADLEAARMFDDLPMQGAPPMVS